MIHLGIPLDKHFSFSGVSIEGEQATIWEAVVARVPRRNIIQCCSAAVLQSERGKRLEVGGRRRNIKCQMTNK